LAGVRYRSHGVQFSVFREEEEEEEENLTDKAQRTPRKRGLIDDSGEGDSESRNIILNAQ
jgi:hypothetical protein